MAERSLYLEESIVEYPKTFFDFNRKLSFITIFNSKKFDTLYKKIFKWILYIFVFVMPCLQIAILPAAAYDIDLFVKTINIVTSQLTGMARAIAMVVFEDNIFNIMASMESSKFHYKPCLGFNPGLVYSKIKHKTESISKIYAFLVGIGSSGIVLPSILRNLFDSNYYKVPNDGQTYINAAKLFSPFWVPFNANRSYAAFSLALLIQTIFILQLLTISIYVDTLFINLMQCLCSHIKILCEALRTVYSRAVQYVWDEGQLSRCDFDRLINQEITNQLKICINHMQEIKRVTNEIENIFSFFILYVAVSMFCITCTCLYLVLKNFVFSDSLIWNFGYLTATSMVLFIFCWYSNNVILETDLISSAAFESQWYYMNVSNKKLIYTIMVFSRKPFRLTCGKFTTLSVATFMSVIQISFSYYTVLRSISR